MAHPHNNPLTPAQQATCRSTAANIVGNAALVALLAGDLQTAVAEQYATWVAGWQALPRFAALQADMRTEVRANLQALGFEVY